MNGQSEICEVVSTNVERSLTLNNEAFRQHLRAIGRAIVADADRLIIDTERVQTVRIYADILPSQNATVVEYRIARIADPRLGEKDE